MAEQLTNRLEDFLSKAQGREVTLNYLRAELKIDPSSSSWENIRVIMHRLVEKNIVKPTGKNDGSYKIITQVKPVQIYGQQRERRPIFPLVFPRDFATGEELGFSKFIVFREGDLITIGGIKSGGKTTLCMDFLAENIDSHPVLMGNEYTVMVEDNYEPAPRFLSRLDTMSDWINWTDESGMDKFTLLPVWDDYAEHIVKDKINIIDWINLDANALYDIGKVLRDIKARLGRGIAIVALQKGENSNLARGGQFVRDFSDVEILLDAFGKFDDNILLTVKGVKEKTGNILGKTYVYTIKEKGTQIHNFREVVKCGTCGGDGVRYVKGEGKVNCQDCLGIGWISK